MVSSPEFSGCVGASETTAGGTGSCNALCIAQGGIFLGGAV